MRAGGPEETNQKLISNCSQNKIESKRAEFKTLAKYQFIGPNKNFTCKILKCERMIDFFLSFVPNKKQRMTNELLGTND